MIRATKQNNGFAVFEWNQIAELRMGSARSEGLLRHEF